MFSSSLPLTGKVEWLSQEWQSRCHSHSRRPRPIVVAALGQSPVWIQERELPCWLRSSRVARKRSNNICVLLVPYHATQGTCCFCPRLAALGRIILCILAAAPTFPPRSQLYKTLLLHARHCRRLWNSVGAWAVSGLRSLDGNMITHREARSLLPSLGDTHSCGMNEDRKTVFNFLDTSKLSKMAFSECSLTGDVLCQTQHLQVTSYCKILSVFKGSLPLESCSEKNPSILFFLVIHNTTSLKHNFQLSV